MDHELRTFTLEEANRLIPTVTQLLLQLKEKQKHVIDLEPQIDALELILDRTSAESSKELNHLIEIHRARVTEFYSAVDQIHQLGCLLKDVELGLIDFYAVLNGKVVYLCWKLGEEKVAFWHEVGQGYAYREPIDLNHPHDGKPDDKEMGV